MINSILDILTKYCPVAPDIIDKIEITDILMVGDFGKDLDDEHALVLAAGLHRSGIINLRGVIANLEPALARATLAKSTLVELGLPEIPVGVGTPCFKGGVNLKHETDAPYCSSRYELELDGELLFGRILRETWSNKTLTLVLNSGLTDTAKAIMNMPDLFKEKVASVVIMGGVVANGSEVAKDDAGFILPQIGKFGAANNNFDEASALFVYRFCQENNIPLTILMREAAYGCQMPFSMYDQLKSTNNPIGANLWNRQQPSIKALWQAANAPEGSPIRGKVPNRCDRNWFVKTFCAGKDPEISGDDDVWSFVDKFQLYDPMNVIAAIPLLRDRFYDSILVDVRGKTHQVIGLTAECNGIRDEKNLRSFIIEMETAALLAPMYK